MFASGLSAHRMRQLGSVATALIVLAILASTLTPPQEMPRDLPGSDKLYHFAAFAALVFPLTVYRPRNALWLVPAAVALGVAIEFIQPYVGRSRELADALANTAGALAGAAVASWAHHVLLRRRA